MKEDSQSLWSAVDKYFAGLLAPSDAALDATIRANRKARLHAIEV